MSILTDGRWPILTAFVALFALLAGCDTTRKENVLRIALTADPSTLDPAHTVDVHSGAVVALIHTGLVTLSTSGEIAPGIAESWTVSPDGRLYTFHLDERRRFANGRRVTAEDVRWSFERLLDPSTASPRSWVLERIEGAEAYSEGDADRVDGIEVESDRKIVLRLSRPFAPMLGLLAMPAAAVLPREEVERLGEDFGSNPTGCGPWRLDHWSHDDELRLVPDPNYGGPPTELGGIQVRVLPEAMTRVAEFETGRLDILEVPSTILPQWRSRTDVRLVEIASLNVSYLGFQNQTPPFDDPRVRRALNLAIDREAILEKVLHGNGILAAGSVPPGLPGGGSRSDPYLYDPDEARRLLREAGYGQGFETEIWQRDNVEVTRILEAVQGYWAQVGVRAKLITREWTAFKQAVNHRSAPVFFLDWWADYPDAENFLFPLFHSSNWGGGGNRACYSSPEVDELIETSHRTPEEAERIRLYRKIDSAVHAQAPWVYLWFGKVTYGVSARIQGFRPSPIYIGNRYTDVAIE